MYIYDLILMELCKILFKTLFKMNKITQNRELIRYIQSFSYRSSLVSNIKDKNLSCFWPCDTQLSSYSLNILPYKIISSVGVGSLCLFGQIKSLFSEHP